MASRILFGNSARPRSSGFESESDARNKRRAIPDRIPLHSFSIASHRKSANASSTPFPLSSLLSLRTFFHTENNLAKKTKLLPEKLGKEFFIGASGSARSRIPVFRPIGVTSGDLRRDSPRMVLRTEPYAPTDSREPFKDSHRNRNKNVAEKKFLVNLRTSKTSKNTDKNTEKRERLFGNYSDLS